MLFESPWISLEQGFQVLFVAIDVTEKKQFLLPVVLVWKCAGCLLQGNENRPTFLVFHYGTGGAAPHLETLWPRNFYGSISAWAEQKGICRKKGQITQGGSRKQGRAVQQGISMLHFLLPPQKSHEWEGGIVTLVSGLISQNPKITEKQNTPNWKGPIRTTESNCGLCAALPKPYV